MGFKSINKIKVYSLNGLTNNKLDFPELSVESINNIDLILLNIKDITIKVSAYDLKKAIDNATNSGY